MYLTSWITIISIQYAISTSATPQQLSPPLAPPASSDGNSITPSITQVPSTPASPASSASATTPPEQYLPSDASLRSIIGDDIMPELPVALTNLAKPSHNASITVPSFTASLPSAAVVTPGLISDYVPTPHRIINYSVPDTQTNLSIILANPGQVPSMDPKSMAQTIISLRSHIRSEINSTGDRWLEHNEDDPLGWEIGLGCWLEFWSNPDKGPQGKQEHLTLGILGAVLDGLLESLVYKGLYDFAYVEIWDSQWGLTGKGFVSPDEGPLNTPNKISSVLATLRIEGKR